MLGKHHVIVESSRLKYSFEIRRNITIIQGDSATDKTTLTEMLAAYRRLGPGQGITVSSDVPVYVYIGEDTEWKYNLGKVTGSLVFIDEDYRFIYTKEFAEYLPTTDNYYIFITRKPIYELPYSTNEIYGIRTSGKYHFPEQIYHEFYPLYPALQGSAEHTDMESQKKELLILVEDKESGYQFFQNVVGNNRCISSTGNSNLYRKTLETDSENGLLVIADGAAFGPYIDMLVKYAKLDAHIALYFPESFEWMILKSGILRDTDINEILSHPEDYIDSQEYISWERFFTALLRERTKDDPVKHYEKKELSSFYTGENAKRILQVMPEEIRPLL